ncbi:hypothetical protein FOZ62_016663, partial [Perkinsus olseni]
TAAQAAAAAAAAAKAAVPGGPMPGGMPPMPPNFAGMPAGFPGMPFNAGQQPAQQQKKLTTAEDFFNTSVSAPKVVQHSNVPNKTLFVENLPPRCTPEKLTAVFKSYPGFEGARVIAERQVVCSMGVRARRFARFIVTAVRVCKALAEGVRDVLVMFG